LQGFGQANRSKAKVPQSFAYRRFMAGGWAAKAVFGAFTCRYFRHPERKGSCGWNYWIFD